MANTVLDTNYPVKTWSRSTVADGDWLNVNTIQPLIDRTNELETDQSELLNMETDVVDTIGEDMQLIPGNRIALIANDATKELSVSLIKSNIHIMGDMVAETVKFPTESTAQAYYNLNYNILNENILNLEGDKITVENGKIYLNTGFYKITCFIAIKRSNEGVVDNKEYVFRLYGAINDTQPVNMSCPFNNVVLIPSDSGFYNMSFALKVSGKSELQLRLCNNENIINDDILETNILKSLTIIEE